MFDWQEIAVALAILGALAYVARRALSRLRSFRAGAKAGACATGCGKCGDQEAAAARPARTLVQIKPTGRAGKARG